MNNEKENIIIPLNEASQQALDEIEIKYDLQETPEEVIEIVKKNGSFRINIVVDLTRDFIMGKLSNTDFLDRLHQGLGTSKETTKNIALDIIDNLIPLLEKIPEDQLAQYNAREREKSSHKKEVDIGQLQEEDVQNTEYDKAEYQRELLNKIKGNAPKPKPAPNPDTPYDKKVEISDVEENAKTMKKEKSLIQPKESPQDLTKAKTVISQEQKVVDPGKPDPYKEPIE